MRIVLLYFDGCPSWQEALDNLRAATDPAIPINLIHIDDPDAAQAYRFVGSPTIRVDGEDLFPVSMTPYGMNCRYYHTPDGLQGWPTIEMIREALDHIHQSK